MGDLAFNIEKFVDLNKVVTLDIDKLVNVNVNNPDILATAEADAEAFGPFALAEVDAYTYVSREEGPPIRFESPAQVDAVGNASVDLFNPDGTPDLSGVIDVGDFLIVDHVDVDDIDGFDHFGDLSSPLPDTPDVPLPDNLLSIENKVLEIVDVVIPGEEFVGELTEDVTISFGQRTLTTLLPENQGPAELTITIAEDTPYFVEQLLDDTGAPIPGDFEMEFAGTPSDVTVEFGGLEIDTIAYTQEAAGIGQAGEWNFDVLVNIIEFRPGTDGGEAFAYAESTAALDLDAVI